MRISADIIYEQLIEDRDVIRTGAQQHALTLRHITFYDSTKKLMPDCVYLARAGDLAQERLSARGICFVCVGGMPPTSLARNGNTVLALTRENDILEVFNAVQEVFLNYEAWDEALAEVLDNTADICEMIEIAAQALGNPITLIDADLHALVETSIVENAGGNKRMKAHSVNRLLNIETVMDFKDIMPTDRRRTEPYLSSEDNLNINLFLDNRYVGVLALMKRLKDFTQGDIAIFEYFAKRMVEGLRKQSKYADGQIVSMKGVLKDLLDCVFVKRTNLHKALGSSDREAFFCFEIKPNQDSYGLPLGYICREIETILPGSMALVHDSLVVTFVRLSNCPHTYGEALDVLNDFLTRAGFQAGIYNVFTDIINARFYFRQACCAIEAGRAIHPSYRYYLFSNYALSCILLNATGDMPPRFVCPSGLLHLRDQSKPPNVDYWGTLKVYLDNEMNATRTAKALYLHRSTLCKRLSRIDDILGLDIHVPLQRLYVQVCLYLLDLSDTSGQ
jgi:hypothetical protein